MIQADVEEAFSEWISHSAYDSKSPITLTIPGNTTPYMSLTDSYHFVQCHMEETDHYGNPLLNPACGKRSLDDDDYHSYIQWK